MFRKNQIMKTQLLTLALGLAAASASAVSIGFIGTTSGAPTYNRATEDGSDLSFVGTDVPFHVQSFSVAGDGLYSFSLLADDPSSFDTFAHLYIGSFNPSDALANFLAGNDDSVSGSPELGSSLTGISLFAGANYFFVISGFLNTDFGDFSASIEGPAAITLGAQAAPVPDQASTLLLAGISFVAVAFLRRRLAK